MLQSRKTFIKTAAVSSAALAFGLPKNILLAEPVTKSNIGGFTKELQSLSYEETAEVVSKMGWDGIEGPVRPGGHVEPERVEEDLPRMVDALRKRDLELHVIAIGIRSLSEPYTEQVLHTAGRLGIRYYRMGWWKYDLSRSIQKQLDDIILQLKDLAALNAEYGIIGIYQNHSGGKNVGAPVWDIYEMLSRVESDYLGCHFDIGHAVVEGGFAWRINYERIKKYIRAVIVKDFKWSYATTRLVMWNGAPSVMA
ncbi:MAG: sugar phosphate isomerase/epimerase family protein [Candidatus Neomarinimicrobiota bacterium]